MKTINQIALGLLMGLGVVCGQEAETVTINVELYGGGSDLAIVNGKRIFANQAPVAVEVPVDQALQISYLPGSEGFPYLKSSPPGNSGTPGLILPPVAKLTCRGCSVNFLSSYSTGSGVPEPRKFAEITLIPTGPAIGDFDAFPDTNIPVMAADKSSADETGDSNNPNTPEGSSPNMEGTGQSCQSCGSGGPSGSAGVPTMLTPASAGIGMGFDDDGFSLGKLVFSTHSVATGMLDLTEANMVFRQASDTDSGEVRTANNLLQSAWSRRYIAAINSLTGGGFETLVYERDAASTPPSVVGLDLVLTQRFVPLDDSDPNGMGLRIEKQVPGQPLETWDLRAVDEIPLGNDEKGRTWWAKDPFGQVSIGVESCLDLSAGNQSWPKWTRGRTVSLHDKEGGTLIGRTREEFISIDQQIIELSVDGGVIDPATSLFYRIALERRTRMVVGDENGDFRISDFTYYTDQDLLHDPSFDADEWQSRFPPELQGSITFVEGITRLVHGATGKLKAVVRSDGGWSKRRYDRGSGTLKESFEPWFGSGGSPASSAATATENNCEHTRYEQLLNIQGTPPSTVAYLTGVRSTGKTMGTVVRVSETSEGQQRTVNLDGAPFTITGTASETTVHGGSIIRNSFSSKSYGIIGETSLSASGNRTARYSAPSERGDWDEAAESFTANLSGAYEKASSADLYLNGAGAYAPIEGLSERRLQIKGPLGRVFEETQVFATEGSGSEWVSVSKRRFTLDSKGRVKQIDQDGGTVSSTVYNANGFWAITDAQGVTTLYSQSADGLTETRVRQAVAGQDAITTVSSRIENGLSTSHTENVSAGGQTRFSSSTEIRDLLGRVVSSIDPLGRSTTFTYPNLLTTVQLLPDNSSLTRIRHPDGKTASVVRSTGLSEYFSYTMGANGLSTEKVNYGSTNSNRWAATTTDGLGLSHLEERSGPNNPTLSTAHFYDSSGRRTKTTAPGIADQLTEYNSYGEAYRSGYDLDSSGALELAGNDPLSESLTRIVKIAAAGGDQWWHQTTRKIWVGATANAFEQSISRTLLGSGSGSTSQSEDENGNTTTAVYAVNRAAATATRTTTSSLATEPTVESFVGGRLSATDLPGISADLTYDAYTPFGQAQTITSPQNGTRVIQYDFYGRQWRVTDGNQRTTTFTYYPHSHVNAGQLSSITDAHGKTIYHAYDGQGRLTHKWGSATYPLKYEYNVYGQNTQLHSYRSFGTVTGGNLPSEFSGDGDTTEWIYDPNSGLLLEKRYPDSKSTSYTYYDNALLKERIWARGTALKTTYTYDDLGRVEFTDHSDSTPDISRTFDRAGRPDTISGGPEGTRAYDYTATPTITYSGGMMDGIVITDTQEAGSARFTGQALALDGTTLSSISYGYEATTARLDSASISSAAHQVDTDYAYDPAHGNLSTITTKNGGATRLTTTFDRDPGGLLNSVLSISGATGPTTGRSYPKRDHVGRIQQAKLPDGTYWQYGYDSKGQVVSGEKRRASGEPFHGLRFGYTFDEIGNRKSAITKAAPGLPKLEVEYTANATNQYTQIDSPASLFVIGESDGAAAVTINTIAALRQGEWFAGQISGDNSVGPKWLPLLIEADKPGGGPGGTDLNTTSSGNLYLPPAQLVPQYDFDGNLTSDGRWSYTWDAENRLTRMTTLASAITAGLPDIEVEYRYDAESRRIATLVTKDGNTQATYYIWKGWTLLAEFEETNPSDPANLDIGDATLSKSYLWGLDWMGSGGPADQGGGASGNVCNLVAIIDHTAGATPVCLLPATDGNGNIISLTDHATGTLATRFDYDAFGNQRLRTNEIAKAGNGATALSQAVENCRWGFSSKAEDFDTGLLYYGYRFYGPEDGRWLNRDPLGERGGVNLYGMVENKTPNTIDILGLALFAFDGTNNREDKQGGFTNVWFLDSVYQGEHNYYFGVGSHLYTKVVGGITGLGARRRLDLAWDNLVSYYENKSDAEIKADPVDIIGFSRGAATAREFANMIYARKDPRKYRAPSGNFSMVRKGPSSRSRKAHIEGCPLPIRFVGLFDTVASFGVPGNWVDIGYRLKLPPNVFHAAHAVSRDERRTLFPVTRISTTKTRAERVFPGVHSDVGGGYTKSRGISLAPLNYIWSQGVSVGVPWLKPNPEEILRKFGKKWDSGDSNLHGHDSSGLLNHPVTEYPPALPNQQLPADRPTYYP